MNRLTWIHECMIMMIMMMMMIIIISSSSSSSSSSSRILLKEFPLTWRKSKDGRMQWVTINKVSKKCNKIQSSAEFWTGSVTWTSKTTSDREFHVDDADYWKDRSPRVMRHVRGTIRSDEDEDRNRWREWIHKCMARRVGVALWL